MKVIFYLNIFLMMIEKMLFTINVVIIMEK